MKKIVTLLSICTLTLLADTQKIYLTSIVYTGSGNSIIYNQFEVENISVCIDILKNSKIKLSSGNESEGGIALTCGGKIKRN